MEGNPVDIKARGGGRRRVFQRFTDETVVASMLHDQVPLEREGWNFNPIGGLL